MDAVGYRVRDQQLPLFRAHKGSSAISSCDSYTQIALEGGADLASRFLTMISADYLNGNDAECRDIEQMFADDPETFAMFCTLAGISPERAQAKVFAMRPDRAPYRRVRGLC